MLINEAAYSPCAVVIAFLVDIPPASAPDQPVVAIDTSSNSYRGLVYAANKVLEKCVEEGLPGWTQLGEPIRFEIAVLHRVTIS